MSPALSYFVLSLVVSSPLVLVIIIYARSLASLSLFLSPFTWFRLSSPLGVRQRGSRLPGRLALIPSARCRLLFFVSLSLHPPAPGINGGGGQLRGFSLVNSREILPKSLAKARERGCQCYTSECIVSCTSASSLVVLDVFWIPRKREFRSSPKMNANVSVVVAPCENK